MTSLLQEYVTHQAELAPHAVALAMNGEQMTYGELEERSTRLARLLKEVGCERGDRICLFLPKTPATIASIIGVLKADCAYVPIDVSSPAPRVAKIAAAADPRLVLVTQTCVELLDEVRDLGGIQPSAAIATIDAEPVKGQTFRSTFSSADLQAFSSDPLDYACTTDDPAHILFTSGSTGVPKGVVIQHRNVIQFVDWATAYFGTRPSDRVSGHPPLHFDLSTFDIFGTLSAGAELQLVPTALNLMPQKLAQLIRDAELTQWFSVPSVMTYMTKFDVIREHDFPSLERVLWCGELLPTPILIHWMKRLPHVRFTNLYGPTEATIASSFYTVLALPETETQAIPIGVPCDGEELLILDSELNSTPTGEIGDLYIAGVGLSPGYWRDEEKTSAAFLPDPRRPDSDGRIYKTGDLARADEDGLIYFLGRADSQIKSRGHRIELGEIETALNALEFVRECAVVGVDTGGFEGTAICCAYASSDPEAVPTRLRAELRAVLPSYMIPSRWLSLDQLPKNVNGKIDRRQLRDTFTDMAENEPAPLSA